jgi:multiple sugar transport system ATP-binding protein
MASIELDNVTKRFGTAMAVDSVSLDIPDRQFIVLLGPSGCGKSTVLRLIAGLEEPDTGQIVIGSRNVTGVPPKERDVAMVFQNYALYPHMSVFDNIAFGIRRRGVRGAELKAAVTQTAASLGIELLLGRRPAQLSGGQRQRVALARAIVRRPVAFLMDEPLSNLDAKLRVQTRRELTRLHDELQTTTVFVTHDQVEAMTLGERVAIIASGRLLQLGRPQDVYDRPENQFVAQFIGSPPMNILPLAVGPEGVTIKETDVRIPPAAVPRALPADSVVGVRPEAIVVGSPTRPEVLAFAATVEAVEHLGAQTNVECSLGGHVLTVVAGGDCRAAPRETLTAWCEPQALHFFDGTTGERLL